MTGWRWGPAGRAAGILICTAVVYLPALGGGYLWDDQLYVRDNLALRSVAGLADLWRIPPPTPQYYPLTFTSFWLEYRLWGVGPLGYHATNVLLHGVNAILVWRLLVALVVPGAYFAALLFAVHPVNVESVAWIAERKNVLSGLFGLVATLSWVGFLRDERPRCAVVTGVVLAAALLCKTQLCTLPVILLLLAWWKRPDEWPRFLPPLVPLAALGVAAAAVTVLSEHPRLEPELALPELDALGRVLVAGRALWFYVAKLVWPTGLVAIYGHWPVNAQAYAPYLFPLGVAAVGLVLWAWRRRLGRGPCVAALAFVVSLAPALGFVRFDFMRFAFVADHFQYLAGIAVIALGAAAGVRLLARHAPAARLAAAVVVAALGVTSWGRATVHRSEETLWRDNVARNPGCAAPYNRLGVVLLEQRRLDEAIASFAAATRLEPRYADAHNNWATALKDQGKLDEAVARYAEALRINPADPVVHNNLGVALQMRGESNEAVRHFAEAVRLDPRYAPPRNNWGAVLLVRGDAAGAAAQYAAAVGASPDYAEAHDGWGVALMALGHPEEALAQHRIAAGLDPSRARSHRELGATLLTLGRAGEAVGELETAVALEPGSGAAYHHLGVALGMTGRVDESLAHLATAAHLDPGDADIQKHWGVALTLAGHLDDAVVRFREALRLRPDDAEARENLARVVARRGVSDGP